MARTFTPEINRQVRYRRTNGSWRSAIITGITSNTIVNLRFGRSAGTQAAAVKQTSKTQVSVWKPW